jgi:hypothetical protein
MKMAHVGVGTVGNVSPDFKTASAAASATAQAPIPIADKPYTAEQYVEVMSTADDVIRLIASKSGPAAVVVVTTTCPACHAFRRKLPALTQGKPWATRVLLIESKHIAAIDAATGSSTFGQTKFVPSLFIVNDGKVAGPLHADPTIIESALGAK